MVGRQWCAGAVVALAGVAALAPQAGARERRLQCKTGYQLYAEGPSILKRTWSAVARNPSGQTDTLTLTVDKSGSFETHLTKAMESEVGGGFGPFSASVKGQFGRELVRAKTVSKGAQYQAKIPPRSEVRVRYGILTRTYKGVILKPHKSDRPEDNPLSPRPLPVGCDLRVAGEFRVRATSGEPAFQRSKTRRFRG